MAGAEMRRASVIVDELAGCGATHLIGLPDNATAVLFSGSPAARLGINPVHAADGGGLARLTVTREGEAFAIAAGLWLGGARPVAVIQNSGLLESGDALRGTVTRLGVPLLCLVGYRGYASLGGSPTERECREHDRAEQLRSRHLDSVAALTEPTLAAWEVPFELYRGDRDVASVGRAWRLAERRRGPVALLLTGALQ